MGKNAKNRVCQLCGVREKDRPGFFANFPREESRCKEWVRLCGNEDLVHIPIELLTKKYVCGDHFREKDFGKNCKRLKKSAIPERGLPSRPLSYDVLADFPQHVASKQGQQGSTFERKLLSVDKRLVSALPQVLLDHAYLGPDENDKVPDVLPVEDDVVETDSEMGESNATQDSHGKVFSWQTTELIEADDPEGLTPAPVPEPPKLPEDVTLSMFCDDSESSEPPAFSEIVVVPENVTHQCKDCATIIDGSSFWCVQCRSAALCGSCASRPQHDVHYVLRAPGGATYSQTQAVLEIIREQLLKKNLLIPYKIEDENVEVIKQELEECQLSPPVNTTDSLAMELDSDPLTELQSDPLDDESHSDQLEESAELLSNSLSVRRHSDSLDVDPDSLHVDSQPDSLELANECVIEETNDHHPFKRPRLMENRQIVTVIHTGTGDGHAQKQSAGMKVGPNDLRGPKTTHHIDASERGLQDLLQSNRNDHGGSQTIRQIVLNSAGGSLTIRQVDPNDSRGLQTNRKIDPNKPRESQTIRQIDLKDPREPHTIRKIDPNKPRESQTIQQINLKDPRESQNVLQITRNDLLKLQKFLQDTARDPRLSQQTLKTITKDIRELQEVLQSDSTDLQGFETVLQVYSTERTGSQSLLKTTPSERTRLQSLPNVTRSDLKKSKTSYKEFSKRKMPHIPRSIHKSPPSDLLKSKSQNFQPRILGSSQTVMQLEKVQHIPKGASILRSKKNDSKGPDILQIPRNVVPAPVKVFYDSLPTKKVTVKLDDVADEKYQDVEFLEEELFDEENRDENIIHEDSVKGREREEPDDFNRHVLIDKDNSDKDEDESSADSSSSTRQSEVEDEECNEDTVCSQNSEVIKNPSNLNSNYSLHFISELQRLDREDAEDRHSNINSVRDMESEVDDIDLDIDYRVDEEKLGEDSLDETDKEDISEVGVGRRTRNATNLHSEGPNEAITHILSSKAAVQLERLTSLDIRKWTANRKRLRED